MKAKPYHFLLMLVVVLTFGNINNSYTQAIQKNKKLVHVLKDSKGMLLGNVYIEDFKGDIFNKLLITRPNGQKTDTLYFINKSVFKNPRGVDITSAEDNFNGYKIEQVKNDSFSLFGIGKAGMGASDPATIIWNYKKKIFEVEKEP